MRDGSMTRRRPIKRALSRLRQNRAFAECEIATLAWLAWGVLRLIRLTVRFETVGADALESNWQAARPMVFAFWHGRSIMLPFLVRGRRDAYIMNSTHRDGEIITRALERFGIHSTRGSSSRGAVAGLSRCCARCGVATRSRSSPPGRAARLASPQRVLSSSRAPAELRSTRWRSAPAERYDCEAGTA
jgi:hypothetical protein